MEEEIKFNPRCIEEGHLEVPNSNPAYTVYTCYREGCQWVEYDPPLDKWPGGEKNT